MCARAPVSGEARVVTDRVVSHFVVGFSCTDSSLNCSGTGSRDSLT